MMQLIEFLKKKERHDFRSKEAKVRIRKINQEMDGIERRGADCFTGLLYGNGEEGEDHDTL
jgi:hypothetical protein